MIAQDPQAAQITLSQQRMRYVFSNFHIINSKCHRLYSNQLFEKRPKLLDFQIGSLSHNKRKKANQKLVCMKFLRDCKTVVLGYDKSSQRGDINFIDVAQPKINDFYYNKLQGGMGGLACFRDGRYIIVADKKGNFTFIDMSQGPNIDDIKNKNIQTSYQGVSSICLSPSQTKLGLGMNRRCSIIDIQKQRKQKIFSLCKTFNRHIFEVNSIDWHPYKSLMISSSLDLNDTIKLWDSNSQQLIQEFNFHKNSIVTHCQFHPQGNTFFSLGKDNTCLEYQLRYKGILNKFYLQSQPTCLQIMDSGEVVIGDTMGYLKWFSKVGEVLKSQKGNSGVVLMSKNDSSNILVVARERQHTFQIMTSKNFVEQDTTQDC